jgi:hypothetical protein
MGYRQRERGSGQYCAHQGHLGEVSAVLAGLRLFDADFSEISGGERDKIHQFSPLRVCLPKEAAP